MTEAYDRLKRLLGELFQFDRADLDFGVYRIMNYKREEVSSFLDNDLLPQVREAFDKYRAGDTDLLRERLAQLEQQAQDLGISPTTIPKYTETQARLEQGTDLSALEDEVYSDLYTFFRRYYKDGDFLSLRRYKEGAYAIPYEGEEVKLHWANADQYYIKTTESFRDYRFRLPDDRHVHFRLVAASTERDNNKAKNGKERRFVLREELPVEDVDGELNIYFEYRPHSDNQKTLNEYALERIFDDPVLNVWEGALREPIPTQTNTQRTTLEKHLGDYAAKNSFDYFIHKDLGRFLRRELDFYLKNEVLHVDDLDAENADRAVQYLAKLGVIKQIGHKIIAFLAQIEDFQKKLFEKKKFVVQVDYCLTLDNVPDDLYPEVALNEEQYAEWEKLFAISEIPASLENGSGDRQSVEWLKANPYLVLDTAFFGQDFKDRLLTSIGNLDGKIGGLLINSENFQALKLLQERYRERVKSIYIDPPYNTGDDGFLYKDSYLHSSWLSMMQDRLLQAKNNLPDNGVLIISIGREELFHLQVLCDQTLGAENRIADLVWEKGRKNDAKYFSLGHDYLLVYGKNADYLRSKKTVWREEKPGAREILAEYRRLRDKYRDDFETIRGQLLEFYRALPKGHPALKHRRYNKVDSNGIWRDDNISWPGGGGPRYDIIHPKTGLPCRVPDRGWAFSSYEKFKLYEKHGFIQFREDHTEPPILKRYLNYVSTDFDPDARRRNAAIGLGDEQDINVQVMPSVFYKNQQPTVVEFRNIVGSSIFTNPKDPGVLSRLVRYVSDVDDTTMDFFAGSGTTGHAVINLNREDGGRRKYILVEMGEYFDTVLKPRIQRVIYSKDWKDGKPVSREGTTHIFKYLKLESYEDTLNNVVLSRNTLQQELVESDEAVKEEYMLSYMLDNEASGSPSLLNSEAFEEPFAHHLKVIDNNETLLVNVDMVETFNYLLGLTVERLGFDDGFRTVEGSNPQDDRVLVIWRNLTEQSNADLDEFFIRQGYGSRPEEEAFDRIYVNGDNNLENLKGKGERWRTLLIEEEFRRLMFGGVGDFNSLVGMS